MAEEIRLLKKKFSGKGEVSGYEFNRIKSNKVAYIYSVGNHFEVLRRTVNKQYNCETYPSSKQWGRIGWTYMTEEAALKKFKKLTKKYSKK